MSKTKEIADRFREVILNGKWIANTNYQDLLAEVSWEEAITKVESLNTIAALTFHITYYIKGVLQVLEGGDLDIRDQYSFDAPVISSENDWKTLQEDMFSSAQRFAELVEKLSDEKLDDVFVDAKYGTYSRNLEAMIEHSYYHMGQVSLIRKMIKEL